MIEKLAAKARALPMQPGVYMMKDAAGKIIYVGKAKKLKNRVSSYFHGAHNEKTEALVSNIDDFDVIVATSEFEALVLENSLIKRHMPKYNILLKDDKGYPFVRLDLREAYPALSVASKAEEDGARYFGPYGSRSSTFAALEAMKKALHLPLCARKFPRDIGRERPCLHYHMGACRAYCLRDTPKAEYDKAIGQAVMILEGRSDELLRQMKAEMEEAAGALRFERAAELRDDIKAISLLETRQYAWSAGGADTDAVGFFRGPKSCFVVLHYVDGQLLGKDYELLEEPVEDDSEAVSALTRQFYTLRGTAPKSVLLSAAPADRESLERFLSELAGRAVRVTVPQRGDKAVYTATAVLNAREEIERRSSREEKVSATARWLQRALNLPEPPERIEAFDISNTGSDSIVAGMVVFSGGKPLRRDYRRFRITTTDGQNDYGSMSEAVGRRMARYTAGDEKFSPLPDVLLIDGGANHAAAAERACAENGVSVPVFGMVKDDRHRTRALVTADGAEIGIAAQPNVFAFVGTIQEEVHRFAVEYHRNLRSRTGIGSSLDGIPGVGEKRRSALLKSFGSIKALRAASPEELAKVVPANTAQAVYDYFHRESGA